MTTRSVDAGHKRAIAEGDWAKLSHQLSWCASMLMGSQGGKLTPGKKLKKGRSDVVVTITPGAGHGSRACFTHGLAEIEIDGKYLEVPPDPKNLAPWTYWGDRDRIPATWGLLCHEAAHAVHTHWKPTAYTWAKQWVKDHPGTEQYVTRILQAAELIEEPRIEGHQVHRRPWDERYLRIMVSTHVLGEMTTEDIAMRHIAMRVVTLAGGRKTTGILGDREAGKLLRQAEEILGHDDFRDAMNLMTKVLNLDSGPFDRQWEDEGHMVVNDETKRIDGKIVAKGEKYWKLDRMGMLSYAKAWLEIVDRKPEITPPEPRKELIMKAVQEKVEQHERELEQAEKERQERQRRWQRPDEKDEPDDDEPDERDEDARHDDPEESDEPDDDGDEGDEFDDEQDGDAGDDESDEGECDQSEEDGEGHGSERREGEGEPEPGELESDQRGEGGEPDYSSEPTAPERGESGQGVSAGPGDGMAEPTAEAQLTEQERQIAEVLFEAAKAGAQIMFDKGFRPWTPADAAEAFAPVWNPVTAEQRKAAGTLSQQLMEWVLPERSVGRNDNVMPPGRLNGRMGIKRQAQRAAGIPPDAPIWRHVTRKTIPTPPIRVAEIVDVSSSMTNLAPASREIAYRFAAAFGQLPDCRFRGYLAGRGISPIQSKPGQVPFYQYRHGVQNVHLAAAELTQSLGLMKRGNARLLIVISDGNLFGVETAAMAAELDKILHTDGHVLWLSFEGHIEGEEAIRAGQPAEKIFRYDHRFGCKVPKVLTLIKAPLKNLTYVEVPLPALPKVDPKNRYEPVRYDSAAAVTAAEAALVKIMKEGAMIG